MNGWLPPSAAMMRKRSTRPELGHARERSLDVALVRAVRPEAPADLRAEQEAGLVQRGEDLLRAHVDAGERLLVGERARTGSYLSRSGWSIASSV